MPNHKLLLANCVGEFLSHYYQRKKAYRKNLSLRSFAKNIRLSPSMLSLVMMGKRRLSVDSLLTVTRELTLSPLEKEYFELLIELETVRHPLVRAFISEQLGVIRERAFSYLE